MPVEQWSLKPEPQLPGPTDRPDPAVLDFEDLRRWICFPCPLGSALLPGLSRPGRESTAVVSVPGV